MFGFAVAVFTLGSLACGLSTSLPMLVASRILQGVGAAFMMPVGRIALLKTFPKSGILRAMNFVIIPALLGPLLGPLTGGVIVHWLPWRMIFLINIPIGIVGLWLVKKHMPDHIPKTRRTRPPSAGTDRRFTTKLRRPIFRSVTAERKIGHPAVHSITR